jgi:pimeloyl-ACP methyl ester carboxylesterase
MVWLVAQLTVRRCWCFPGPRWFPLFVVVRALGRRYRVISAAYRPPAPWQTWLPVSAILDAEQVSTVHVVGSSFGGYLAQCVVRAPPRAG